MSRRVITEKEYFERITITPTHRTRCSESNQGVAEDMSRSVFDSLTDRLRVVHGVKTITFGVGVFPRSDPYEPTLWEHLPHALDALHQQGIITVLATDGLSPPVAKHFSSALTIHLTHYFESKENKQKIQDTIRAYKERGSTIRILCPFNSHITQEEIEEVIRLGGHFGVLPVFVPDLSTYQQHSPSDIPHVDDGLREKWLTILRILNDQHHTRVRLLPRIVPICDFSAEDRATYPLRGTCVDCHQRMLVIDADGKSVRPCSLWPYSANVLDSPSLRELFTKHFEPHITRTQKAVPTSCTSCVFLKKSMCFAGCPAIHVGRNAAKKPNG